MRTMSSRSRVSAALAASATVAVLAAGCGGSTVEGEAPEVSTRAAASSTQSSAPFAEERPEKPSSPVSPPPPSPSQPAPAPEPAPAPGPAPGEPAPPPAPAPGGGDFAALLQQQGITLPEGVDPGATAIEACGRFDQGQQMVEVSDWVGQRGALNPEQQGFFLGAAVGTYCPQNFPKLG